MTTIKLSLFLSFKGEFLTHVGVFFQKVHLTIPLECYDYNTKKILRKSKKKEKKTSEKGKEKGNGKMEMKRIFLQARKWVLEYYTPRIPNTVVQG
jgi:hypothetical protein